MSLIDNAIRSAAKPKSFWIMLAVGFLAPIIALPYLLLLHYGVIEHTILGFRFFLAVIVLAWGLLLYYIRGRLAGKYRDLEGRSWSELPW